MKVYAAPLQGYTEKFFRNAHGSVIGGIEEYYTPFLRLEQGGIRGKELSDVEKTENLFPEKTVPQILVKNASELSFFAEKLFFERGWKRIDLNFGCPYPPVVKRGYGAGILENLSAMREVLECTAKFPRIGFSVKCRLPEKEENLRILQEYPLVHIVLHPRKALQEYRGTPDEEAFARFCAFRGKNPVIYNGDIFSPENVPSFVRENNLSVMAGRGLLQDPLLGRKLAGEHFSPEAENDLNRAFHDAFLAFLLEGTKKAEEKLPRLKTFWEYFLPQKEKRLRKRVLKSRSFAEYTLAVKEIFET